MDASLTRPGQASLLGNIFSMVLYRPSFGPFRWDPSYPVCDEHDFRIFVLEVELCMGRSCTVYLMFQLYRIWNKWHFEGLDLVFIPLVTGSIQRMVEYRGR